MKTDTDDSKSINAATFPEIADRKVAARIEGVRRFRKNWRRIDYYPGPDALRIIDQLREDNPKHTIGQLIDHLVIRGARQVSGND